MELPDRTQAKTWEGRDVADRDGQPLGRCVGVFADTATGVAEWLHVDVQGHARSFVPALEATETDGTVRVRFSREQVLSAPSVGDDVQLSKAEEIELYHHYGVPVDREGSDSVLPSDAQAQGGSATGDRSALVGSGTAEAADEADGADPDEQAVLATTGLDLPVLDPAAASTPVPESSVTYVDEPEDFASGEPPAADSPAGAPVAADEPAADEPAAAAEPAPAAAPSLPPPTLRRVTQSSTASTAPSPAPQQPSGGGAPDLSAAAPLGAVAGLVALVALALRARDRRARRRNSPAARADRLRQTLKAGSAAALSSAGSSLAAVPDAAAQTRRQAADAAAQTRRQAAEAAAQASRRAARRQAKASASASRAARRRKRQAAASLSAASQAAQRQKRQASAAVGSASRRGRSTTGTVAAVPTRIARRGRKARKSLARKVWELVLLGTAGGGYVLGAKAGRERYDELSQVAGAVAAHPKVQSATEAVTDPQRRADLLGEVQQLVGRRGGHSG